MRTIVLLLAILASTYTLQCQGIYRIWGTGADGGTDNLGYIYHTDAAGNNYIEDYQFSFLNSSGYYPGSVPAEFNGKVYGTTLFGGDSDAGVIFELNPVTGVYTRKISLNGNNGRKPSELYLAGSKFYGTTSEGGANNLGVIFEWDPVSNIYTRQYDFNTAGGAQPYGRLALYNGKLYGLASAGGANGSGTIFEWDPSTNIFVKKVDLAVAGGSHPYGSLTLRGGKFYGVTWEGGVNNVGVIFEWDPTTNAYNKKIDLATATGGMAGGTLVEAGGKMYGLTARGGAFGNNGALFEWDIITNTYLLKHSFTAGDGGHPGTILAIKDGKLYGVTANAGKIFEWDPASDSYSVKRAFALATGIDAQTGLALIDGKFYGTTLSGGSAGLGVLFEWDPATDNYAVKENFFKSTGAVPADLTLKGNKLYGIARDGGVFGSGVIFEIDASTGAYTKRLDLNIVVGTTGTYGALTEFQDKFYASLFEGDFPSNGQLFEWDPVANIYTKKITCTAATGSYPVGSPVLYAGKFYGTMQYGGDNNAGVIYEWDPVSNIYTKKIDLENNTGSNPNELVMLNNKFYGTTISGGVNNSGVIFEWDPATNIYTKKIDLERETGFNPVGHLTYKDGKFYGMSRQIDFNLYGVLFEWDPVANIYTKKIDFNETIGYNVIGSLIQSGNFFYGATGRGGASNAGVLFQWDPVSNNYTIKKNFTPTPGKCCGFEYGSTLALAPAPPANGIANSCESFPVVAIDNSNNNIWIPITDSHGDAVAEIKANGNNLGTITSSAYINNGPVREDNAKRLYLDRNLTITPQFQPVSPVDIRIYIKASEYEALKNAVNSIGDPSGISNINDVGFFKNSELCQSFVQSTAIPVSATGAQWGGDYVLTASINSFSSFYVANKLLTALPLTLLEFNGRLNNGNAQLTWKTDNETNTARFVIERSFNGTAFTSIGAVQAANTAGTHIYSFIDERVNEPGPGIIYYRVKMIDHDSHFRNSRTIALAVEKSKSILLYPNPVSTEVHLVINNSIVQNLTIIITDNAGRTVMQKPAKITGNTTIVVDVNNLEQGVYYLKLQGATINEHKQFIKR